MSNCQATEILAEELTKSKGSRLTPPICGGDSCCADVTVDGWWHWYLHRFTPPLYLQAAGVRVARLHCSSSFRHGQLVWRPAWTAEPAREAGCLLEQLTCVESAAKLYLAESWRASVHIAAVPVVWVSLQERFGTRSKYRIALRRQQTIKVLKLWEQLKSFG